MIIKFAKPFIVWFASFFGFLYINKFLPILPLYVSYFISSIILMFTSFYFVVCFSNLNFNRTTYLVIGLISIILLVFVSKPIINRASEINKLSNLHSSSAILTTLLGNIIHIITPNSVIILRNKLYSQIYNALDNLIPESIANIFAISLFQILLASGLGLWIGNGIDKRSHLLAVAIVATIADIWSVFHGATYIIIRSTTINYFLLRFPLLFSETVSFPFLIGLSDFIFFAIYFQSAIRFELGIAKNFIILAVGFAITIFLAIILKTGLPVLPFISLLFLAFNFRHLEIQIKELKLISLFLLLVGLVFILITLLAH